MDKGLNSSGLQTIIREVSKSTEAPRSVKGKPATQKIVIIDTKKRKAVDPLLARFFDQNLRYYLVSNSDNPGGSKAWGSFLFPYREDPPGSRSLDIDVDYSAVCPVGNERILAEALCIVPDPTEALKSMIFKWIDESIHSSKTSFIDSFEKMKTYLVSLLKTKARNEMGLQLEVAFRRGHDLIPPFEDVFPVRFKDHDREASLRIKVELERTNLAPPQTKENMTHQQVVQIAVRKYFASFVSIQNFHFDLNKDGFKQNVLNRLDVTLRSHGYRLLFISMERSENGISDAYFEIKTEESEQQFQTNTYQFPVRLSILVSARLTDLEKAKPYLLSKLDVSTEMKKAMLRVTAQFLRGIDPGRYYVRFSSTHEPGEYSVKEELKTAISQTLEREFGVQIREVTLRMEETEITKVLNDLKRSREDFTVEFTPLSHSRPYDVLLTGNFRVMAIDYDGWDNFVTSLPTIDQVKRRIVESIRTDLQQDASLVVVYQNSQELEKLIRAVAASAEKAALRDFGIRVTIGNLGRERSARESRMIASIVDEERLLIDSIAAERQSLIKNVIGQIGRLKGKLADAIMTQAGDEEMREIKLQISSLERELGVIRQSDPLSLSGAPESKQLPESTGP